MLVKFSSPAAGAITMFGDIAAELIRMLGAGGSIPGALGADDVAGAAARLRRELAARPGAEATPPAMPADPEAPAEPVISLATRAAPLLELLQRAEARHAPVLWDAQ